MSIGDKLEAMKDKTVGHAKEAVGKVTDNTELEAEGKAQRTEGAVREGAEKVKDAGHDAAEGVADAARGVKNAITD